MSCPDLCAAPLRKMVELIRHPKALKEEVLDFCNTSDPDSMDSSYRTAFSLVLDSTTLRPSESEAKSDVSNASVITAAQLLHAGLAS